MAFKEYPVRVGSMLYTQVDPHRGYEVDYNRWYERDHFYAGCMIGPWLFAGRRWVATRAQKDLRFPAQSPVVDPIDAGSYLATYWIHDGHYDDHIAWATEQVNWLYANDRGYQHRTHVHTAMYGHQMRWYRDDDPVPLELAFDHPYQGLVSVCVERDDGTSQAAVDDWFSEQLPGFLADSPVAAVSSWTPLPLLDAAPSFVPRDPKADQRAMQLYFLEDDPGRDWGRWQRWAEQINGSGRGRVVWCGPWIPTLVGTDRYTDQLW